MSFFPKITCKYCSQNHFSKDCPSKIKNTMVNSNTTLKKSNIGYMTIIMFDKTLNKVYLPMCKYRCNTRKNKYDCGFGGKILDKNNPFESMSSKINNDSEGKINISLNHCKKYSIGNKGKNIIFGLMIDEEKISDFSSFNNQKLSESIWFKIDSLTKSMMAFPEDLHHIKTIRKLMQSDSIRV